MDSGHSKITRNNITDESAKSATKHDNIIDTETSPEDIITHEKSKIEAEWQTQYKIETETIG